MNTANDKQWLISLATQLAATVRVAPDENVTMTPMLALRIATRLIDIATTLEDHDPVLLDPIRITP